MDFKSSCNFRIGSSYQVTLTSAVRTRCASLASAVDLLTTLKHRSNIATHFDHIVSYTGAESSQKLLDEFKALLKDRTVGLGVFYVPYDLADSDGATSAPEIRTLRAVALDVDRANHPELAFNSFLAGLNSQPFSNAFSTLEELWLSLNSRYLTPQISWPELESLIPWTKLRRLVLHGPAIQSRLNAILPHLTSLRCLRLRADRLLAFHQNCPYAKNAIFSDVNHPYFEIDFSFLPCLTSLSIEGICNHVPIHGLVSPRLRSLKLHRRVLRVSVSANESQRSSADLNKIAKIAPDIEKLELDIGFIENLWHPAAIPGVDVDPELYRFLQALSNFKHLRYLRFFPPYVSRYKSAHGHASASSTEYQQPCSDEQAIRLFNHLRLQNPKLSFFSISPANQVSRSSVPSAAMTWEVRPWGEKTLLTTRQLGKEYELRQIWVGERKVSSEVKRDSYHRQGEEYDEEGWVLRSP